MTESYADALPASSRFPLTEPAITVFDGYDAIVDACCTAWNFFANDPETVTSITSRSWAQVNA